MGVEAIITTTITDKTAERDKSKVMTKQTQQKHKIKTTNRYDLRKPQIFLNMYVNVCGVFLCMTSDVDEK